MADTPRLPDFVNWPSFPFEGQLRTKRLEAPVSEEPPREGEDPSTCAACGASDDSYVWVSDRWRVRAMDRPSGLPMVLILESRSHLDLGDLTNLLAAELGVMTVRLERAIRSLDGVERVHVNRWGDGAAHLHMWFLARPTGYVQLRGSFLSLWDDILEPISDELWRENLSMVAAWLGEFGGRIVAEPPRIVWHAPSRFGDDGTLAIEAGEEPVVEHIESVMVEAEPPATATAGQAEPSKTEAGGPSTAHPTAATANGGSGTASTNNTGPAATSDAPVNGDPAGRDGHERQTTDAQAGPPRDGAANGEPHPSANGADHNKPAETNRPPVQRAADVSEELSDWGLSDEDLAASDILI